MSYLALYRRYRPQKFSDVVGQEHITMTLSNSLKSGNVSHAYLFTGSRGTGKTTVAKIFARAVNCETPLADGSPCGKCRVCTMSENMDIIEIDAASNNGVDEIRELREKVRFVPLNGKYKVYIIDEVHMLTQAAFNALLKTLEEPPENTMFILATTDVQRLPATVLSRCMRFDFRLIGTKQLAALVKSVFDDAKQKADDDAVNQIALSGAGSARDALSVADMCRSFAPEHITYQDVLTVIGASDPMQTVETAQTLLAGKTGEVVTEVGRLVELGKSPAMIAKDLTSALRDLGIVSVVNNPASILTLPADRLKKLSEVAQKTTPSHIAYCIDTLCRVENDLKYGLSPRLLLENAVIKCCQPTGSSADGSVDAKIQQLEKKVADLEERLRQEEES